MKPLSIVSLFVLGTLSATASSTPARSTSGLINVASNCGDIGATNNVTATSGPNGNIDWLNCGITSSGWTPPMIKISDLVVVVLSTAIQQTDSPFKPCEPYLDLFNKYAEQFNVPPILLASLAMEGSTCNPATVGGAGQQGLMQIPQDKCNGMGAAGCSDPDFNIRTGAELFADTLNDNDGDILLAIGGYDGWTPGMTYDQATAAANTSCCTCQNNLDYLHQILNGWCQNVNAYGNNPRLGKYFNLDKCNE